MIGALERLRAEQGVPSELPDSIIAFGIRTGGKKYDAFIHDTPAVEERITALQATR